MMRLLHQYAANLLITIQIVKMGLLLFPLISILMRIYTNGVRCQKNDDFVFDFEFCAKSGGDMVHF